MEPADYETYRAAIHGDLEAFELVIRNMSRPLFAIAFGALQNREEAEDVVQDAFVKAWKARWQVRDPEKFPAWMATIARNRAIDYLRSVDGRMEASAIELDHLERPGLFAKLDSAAMAMDRVRRLKSAFEKLTPTQRQVIELAYYEAGHMMYVHEPSRIQQSEDLAAFVRNQ